MANIQDCPGFEPFGEDVKVARKKLRLSRQKAAEMAGISTVYLRTCIHNLKRRVDGSFSAILRCVFLQYTKYFCENAPCLAEKSLVPRHLRL